jgi:hypothetical protein
MIILFALTAQASFSQTYFSDKSESYLASADTTKWILQNQQKTVTQIDLKSDSIFVINNSRELHILKQVILAGVPKYFCFDPELNMTCFVTVRKESVTISYTGSKFVYYRITAGDY